MSQNDVDRMEGLAAPPRGYRKTEEGWYSLLGVDTELVGNEGAVEMEPAAFEALLGPKPPLPVAGWEQLVDADIDRHPWNGQLPDGARPPRDPKEVWIQAAALSSDTVEVIFVRDGGNYLWHHYRDVLLRIRVARTPDIDRALRLGLAEKEKTTTYGEVRVGMAHEHVRALLGDPDAAFPLQPLGMTREMWRDRDVEIECENFRVTRIRRPISANMRTWMDQNGK